VSATGRPNDAAQAGLAIAHALERAGVPYALGGALALGAHGVPRGTLDVDVNVFVDEAGLPFVLQQLEGLGIELDVEAAIARAKRDGMCVGRWAGMRIDLFIPSIPFSHEAGRTRVLLTEPSGDSVWFLAAEAITIFKLLFFRPKDLADLERLAAVQGPELDRAYVRKWITEMMGEHDERVAAWDRIAATA
jgi:hypothetical protein